MWLDKIVILKSLRTPDILAKCNGGCRNGGRCIAPNTCECQVGYSGTSCKKGKQNMHWKYKTAVLSYYPFRISILLILNIISFTAICSPPCLNGGRCLRPPNTCKCLTSFTGKYCELKSHSKKSIANRNNKTTLTDMSSSGKHRRGHQSHLRRNHKKQRKRRKWKTKEMLNKLNSLHQNSLIRSP